MSERLSIETDFTLLLTATVQVNASLAGLTSTDPISRQQEYAGTLRYYLTEHPRIRRLVFAENSGWPLAPFQDVTAHNPLGKTVELLQLDCNAYSGSLGKGYGEALLIDRALSASRLAGQSRYIGKLTGRQRVANLTALLSRLPKGFAFVCDLRDHGLYERLGLPGAGRWCDTRFFVFAQPFFDRTLRGLYRQPTGGEFNLEDAYYRAVHPLEGPDVICRFPVEPSYRGFAGHWNKNYGGLRSRAKQAVRGALRFALPRLRL
jgi:hypothetical protein